MQATGFHETADDKLAALAFDCTLERYPLPLHVVTEAAHYSGDLRKWEKQLRKQREREEKEAYDAAKVKMMAQIRSNPQAYGIGVLGLIFLGFRVAEILWPIIRWLFAKRYESGGDHAIQQAIGAV